MQARETASYGGQLSRDTGCAEDHDTCVPILSFDATTDGDSLQIDHTDRSWIYLRGVAPGSGMVSARDCDGTLLATATVQVITP